MANRKAKHYVGQRLLLILMILFLGLLLFIAGLMVGYGIIGDGESIWDILTPEKWQEIMGKFTGR